MASIGNREALSALDLIFPKVSVTYIDWGRIARDNLRILRGDFSVLPKLAHSEKIVQKLAFEFIIR